MRRGWGIRHPWIFVIGALVCGLLMRNRVAAPQQAMAGEPVLAH